MLIADARFEGAKIQGVESGGFARIGGMVGRLVVQPGGSAELGGMCTGDATNHGGDLTITGVVTGSLYGGASTHVAPGTRIGR